MVWYFYINQLLTYKIKIFMKNFFKNLFSLNESEQVNPEEKIRKELEKAVWADDVQQVYEMLKCGINDINFYVFYDVTTSEDGYDYYTKTVTSCLMDIARSEPMKRLLRHYGALSLREIEEIQKNEEAERRKQREREYAEKRKKEEEILKQKAEADNRFLDSVLR